MPLYKAKIKHVCF